MEKAKGGRRQSQGRANDPTRRRRGICLQKVDLSAARGRGELTVAVTERCND